MKNAIAEFRNDKEVRWGSSSTKVGPMYAWFPVEASLDVSAMRHM
jgi:hypothetical protein